MRNPWPMFCVLAVSAALCITCPTYALWLILLSAAVFLIIWIAVPIKWDEWLAKKLNPCLLEYQQSHDLAKLEAELNRWKPWAITRSSRNAIEANWFCALLQQNQQEKARSVLEQIRQHAKTTAEHRNYHMLMAAYAKNIADEALADSELRQADELKEKMTGKDVRPSCRATGQQCRRAFFLWLSFSAFLLIGGSVCAMVLADSLLADLGAEAVLVSFLAMPVALVWLGLWIIRRRRERIL